MAEQAFGPPSSRPAMTLQLLTQNRSSRPDLALPEDTPGPAGGDTGSNGRHPPRWPEGGDHPKTWPAGREGGAPDVMFEDRRGFPRGFRAPGGLYRGFPAIAPGPLSDASPLAGDAGERGAGPLLVPDFPCWA